MTTLLQINTSLFAENGQSSKLARDFVASWKARHADGRVVVRDLATQPLPHLDAARFGAPESRMLSVRFDAAKMAEAEWLRRYPLRT